MAESIAHGNYNPPSAVQSADLPFQTLVNGVNVVGKRLEGISAWQMLLTVLVLSITYDQCLLSPC